MNFESNPARDLRVLYVKCAPCDSGHMTQWARQFDAPHDAYSGLERMARERFDCVVCAIDPSDPASLQQLKAVKVAANRAQTPLVSVSPFNPPWIDNLMHQLGVTAHFKTLPNADDFRRIVATKDPAHLAGDPT